MDSEGGFPACKSFPHSFCVRSLELVVVLVCNLLTVADKIRFRGIPEITTKFAGECCPKGVEELRPDSHPIPSHVLLEVVANCGVGYPPQARKQPTSGHRALGNE